MKSLNLKYLPTFITQNGNILVCLSECEGMFISSGGEYLRECEDDEFTFLRKNLAQVQFVSNLWVRWKRIKVEEPSQNKLHAKINKRSRSSAYFGTKTLEIQGVYTPVFRPLGSTEIKWHPFGGGRKNKHLKERSPRPRRERKA